SSFVIVGRFSVPARSIAFFSARSHCFGSAFFLVFNAVSGTPNSRCFRHRNHTPSNVPRSISSASDLQIGHVAIAISHSGTDYTLVQAGQCHSIINTSLPTPSHPLPCATYTKST